MRTVLGVIMVAAWIGCGDSGSDGASALDGSTTQVDRPDGAPGGPAFRADASVDASAGERSDGSADATADQASPSTLQIDGYWVWKETVENDAVTQSISDDDMTWKVGEDGWPGCPAGISCTKYGINVLYIDSARFHHMHRVTTGSDSQMYGSYTLADDVVTVQQQQRYSCAHPRNRSEYPAPATLYARIKRQGDDLWITPFSDTDPGAAAARWTVYRPTTKADAHNKYDHPFCGDAREGGECHCLCPSQDVLADHACGG